MCVLVKTTENELLENIQNFLDDLEVVTEQNNVEYILKTKNGSYIYNEFSLQHELGIYLRQIYSIEGYKIEFERNSKKFFDKTKTKHEIDIVIYNGEKKLAAIELKFPRNGQYPESMYSFVKDIRFLEELSFEEKEGFQSGILLTIVDDCKFYNSETGKRKLTCDGIYKYFRINDQDKENTLWVNGKVDKPTGNKKSVGNEDLLPCIELIGKYQINWKKLNKDEYNSPIKYFLINAKKQST